MGVWKCADCFHANQGEPEDVCYWCGSDKRTTLQPVKVPNAQQGTPDYTALSKAIDEEEANRMTDESFEAQLERLLEEFEKEMANGEAEFQGAEAVGQVGVCSAGAVSD